MKTLYISGAISNAPNLNKEKFANATKKLRSLGYIVINPHEICSDIPASQWEDCMKICIKRLMDADIIIMLDDWQQSRGATVEFKIAQTVNISQFLYNDFINNH